VISFAKEAGARITAFHAKPEYPKTLIGEGALRNSLTPQQYTTPQQYAEFSDARADEILGTVEDLCREAGVECSRLTLTSNVVYAAIIEAATQSGCDLIFMASHGRRGLGALLLGSETNKVLTHTNIPVLVYR
jgi:nucleotide-binding universal stress UspA family protein